MSLIKQSRSVCSLGIVSVFFLALTHSRPSGAATAADLNPNALDRGFLGLYNLDFDGAQKDFSSWETQHPDDPMGPVSEAAGYLFSEFNRLGVLEGQFYDNNKSFFGRSQREKES